MRPRVCCGHCVGFLRLSATRKTQTVHMHGAFDISRHRAAVPPCAGCKRRSTNAEAEAKRTRPTERRSQELEHQVVRSAPWRIPIAWHTFAENTSCQRNFVKTTRVGNYHVSHKRQPSLLQCSSSRPTPFLKLPTYGTSPFPELGNKKSELCVCSSVSRVSKACNLARMIAPAERNWVPDATVPAVRLDAAPTTGDASRWI